MAEFSDTLFVAPDQRVVRMASLLWSYIDRRAASRVLDVGCGTGAQILHLASELPNASFVGIDISAANIERARRDAAAGSLSQRVKFEAADYMRFLADPYDVVIADSSIQWIEAEADVVIGKLAADIRPGGLFVLTMPTECLYNDLLLAVRKALRAVRGPLTDKSVLAAARLLHGRRHDDEFLRQRVDYMYWIPYRLWGDDLRALFLGGGLFALEREESLPRDSLGQPKHCAVVLRRQ